MIHKIEPFLTYFEPLTCSLLALSAVIFLPVLFRRIKDNTRRVIFVAVSIAVFFIIWHLSVRISAVERWLLPLSSPIVAVYMVIILPSLYISRTSRWWKLYRIIPIVTIMLAVMAVFEGYRSVPESDRGFYWFLIRPAYLLGGVASLLILIQPFMSMKRFRFAVRSACFVVLVYGGFMFRQNYEDYQAMLQRRGSSVDIMLMAETTPVMRHDWRMLHLPSAPCRFTADGGYIQGCNMELFQRVLQVDTGALMRRDKSVMATMAVIIGAVAFFLTISFIAARWMCGWLCPLSAMGDIIDWVRKKFGFRHLKPAQPVKLSFFFSGLGVAAVTLAMAKAYPYLDESGRFLGCKIPIYPFCKICPSQQLCPVMAGGPAAYPGFPNWEWGAGFFSSACITLMAIFLIGFTLSRRLWCRFCPMGMISGLFNRGGAFKLVKNSEKCNRCGVCAEVCPMDIDYVRSEMRARNVSSFDCVLCLKCIEKCPKDGCLSLEHAGAKVVESRFTPV